MKKITIIGIVLLFCVSLVSCEPYEFLSLLNPGVRVNRGPYQSFTAMDLTLPGVEQPEQSWTYHWPERYSEVLEASSKLVVDNDGNIYFVGQNYYLYSIDTNGELRWLREYYKDHIEITEQGIVTSRMNGYLALLDFNGQPLWSKKFLGIDDFWLAPDGTIVIYSFGFLVGVDANGKTKWRYEIGNHLLKGCFFDQNANSYFIFWESDYDRPPIERGANYYFKNFIVSVTPDGEKRWEKILAEDRNFVDDFLPKGIIQDTYLLAFTTSKLGKQDEGVWEDQEVQPKIIKAYNTDGEEIWQRIEEKQGSYECRYSIDKNNRFYYHFHENFSSDEKCSEYYTCMSSTGDVIWENHVETGLASTTTFDENNNSYVGFITKDHQEGMYSFYPNGDIRWTLNNIDVACGFKNGIVLSPLGKIHFTTWCQSLIFCIDDASKK